MTTFSWIFLGGLGMMSLVLVGPLACAWGRRGPGWLRFWAGTSVGTLSGGAIFHMMPAALGTGEVDLAVWTWTGAGFLSMVLLDGLMGGEHRGARLSAMVVLGDGLHNLVGGVAVATAFLVDPSLGVAAWVSAAAHEVPQEVGDHAVLLREGMTTRQAVGWNLLSGSTFLIAGLFTWAVSSPAGAARWLPLAAGQFLYLAAALSVSVLAGAALRQRLGVWLSAAAGMGVMAWLATVGEGA